MPRMRSEGTGGRVDQVGALDRVKRMEAMALASPGNWRIRSRPCSDNVAADRAERANVTIRRILTPPNSARSSASLLTARENILHAV